ncbi:Arc domain-containing protein [Burkholderia lata]|uniref:Arc family DNA-binding protein n=1 Tax=Burkholderia lata (strain ATCC 17760 / DSM 23089 / LMG 22485 / NCIMB 9086 / R18194 / 383) TaxID=482957 RepID=UPI0014535003|nr:Arc family DNA-binding protein [Burkholderia lata]VWB80415.1 Arc domain-containing protein [Burkholderia lata]
MTSDDLQTNLRLPADLKAKLKQIADANNRSMNAEVVARLEESLERDVKGVPPVDDRTMDLFADTVAGKVVQVLDEREKKRRRPT